MAQGTQVKEDANQPQPNEDPLQKLDPFRVMSMIPLLPYQVIADVGCGKGFLLYEFTQVLPGVEVSGIDISQYALENAKEEVLTSLRLGTAIDLPYEDRQFDLVVSINTLHNLYNYDLRKALQEIERVGKEHKHVAVDSYRTEREKVNLMYWHITCECFYTPHEWE
ncbi:MAG: class I SAM-dependent methyltransferase, partial [Proteobacteria bacterium]|nr:class I SAM-dependent methyltransferase [Pseudomonadota bacterium]